MYNNLHTVCAKSYTVVSITAYLDALSYRSWTVHAKYYLLHPIKIHAMMIKEKKPTKSTTASFV